MKRFALPIICITLPFASSLCAKESPRYGILANGKMVYTQKQKVVNSLSDMFQEGNIYGRIRNNNFYFRWSDSDSSHENQLVAGVGGSFVYKSASFNGFDTIVGLYGSHSFFDESKLDSVSHLKPARDTLSRFDYINTGSHSLYAFAQANIGYRYSKTTLRVGRQLVETFYTKSNDTKMIPNAFDGVVLASKDIPETALTFAYLARQKARDHRDAHAVFMVGDANSSSATNPKWSEQDDSAMHYGLTYSALKSAGKPTDAPLFVLDLKNKSVQNLSMHLSSYIVPKLLSQAMGELSYTFNLGSIKLTPAVRGVWQFDNGAGKVGGASLYPSKTGLDGYKDPYNLDSSMYAARVGVKISDYRVRLAYTGVSDKADLVTPWRGFPTAGYTRSMGVYNWRANVKSYRIELVKDANKKGVYAKPFIQTSVLYVDGDQKKSETDKMVYYFGIVQNIPSFQSLQYRLRLAYNDIKKSYNGKDLPNYLDSRFELNLVF